MADSSIFKCFEHDFGCDDPVNWSQHCADEDHTYSGETTCRNCGFPGTVITYVGKLAPGSLPPAYCDTCKEKLKSELGL